MKARVHRITITTELNEPIDTADFAQLTMLVLQDARFPRGQARIDVQSFDDDQIDELREESSLAPTATPNTTLN